MISRLRKLVAVSAAGVTLALTVPFAQAGFVQADAEFSGIFDIRTTGTASVSFLGDFGLESFVANSLAAGGILDPLSDGMFFDSTLAADAEGTATNAGSGEFLFSQSFAEANSSGVGSAATFVETEIELAGAGTIEIDLGFSLLVDGFDNGADAFALAEFFGFTTSSAGFELFQELDAVALAGAGTTALLVDVVTLMIDVDDFGFGPYTEFLSLGTVATARASEPAAVPEPSVLWTLGIGLVALAGRRRLAWRR